jgi:hypothetical protein
MKDRTAPWISQERMMKGWHDLNPDETLEAIRNSDETTYDEHGVDPYMVIGVIESMKVLSEEEKKTLVKIIKTRAGITT